MAKSQLFLVTTAAAAAAARNELRRKWQSWRRASGIFSAISAWYQVGRARHQPALHGKMSKVSRRYLKWRAASSNESWRMAGKEKRASKRQWRR